MPSSPSPGPDEPAEGLSAADATGTDITEVTGGDVGTDSAPFSLPGQRSAQPGTRLQSPSALVASLTTLGTPIVVAVTPPLIPRNAAISTAHGCPRCRFRREGALPDHSRDGRAPGGPGS